MIYLLTHGGKHFGLIYSMKEDDSRYTHRAASSRKCVQWHHNSLLLVIRGLRIQDLGSSQLQIQKQ